MDQKQQRRLKILMNKSFILKQNPPELDPLPKLKQKQPSPNLLFFGNIIVSTINHLLFYPIDAMKVRFQAHHISQDVSRFKANQVSRASIYLGILRGYYSILITATTKYLCSETYGYNIYFSTIPESILKTWVQISKMNKIMKVPESQIKLMMHAYKLTLPVIFVRDAIFRYTFTNFSQFIKKKIYQRRRGRFLTEDNLQIYFLAILVAGIVSNPFDMIFTRIATQRYLKYQTLFQTLQVMYKEQGLYKIMFGGIAFRLTYLFMNFSLIFHCGQNIQNGINEAFGE